MLLFNYAGATIIALLIFLIIYGIRPVIITESNRIFSIIVVSEIIGALANLLSSWADNNGPHFFKPLLIILNNIYYFSYIARYFIFCLYFAALLQIDKYKNAIFLLTLIITTGVSFLIFSSPWTGIIYELSPENVFSTGDLVVLIYISNLFTILLNIYYIAISFKKINIKDKIALILSIFILLSCCVIDFIFIDYVISDIFFILELLILYLMFENPDSYYDKRTNILNSQAFRDLVTNNIFRQKNTSILCFEIKNYSEIKAIYGLKQIDLLLSEIADFLQNNFFRKNSFYLQNGKFAVIKTHLASGSAVKESIYNRFKEPWKLKNNTDIVLDVVLIDLDKSLEFQSYSQIESCIDQATNELKKMSKKDININEVIFNKVLRKTKVLQILTKSLDENKLLVYYQPIIDAKSRKIVAAEALARLYDKDLGIIPPIEFITMAEENGLIEKLGEQVLEKVCILIKKVNIEQYGIKWINVNLSPIQCQNKNLIDIINAIIKRHDVPEYLIHFEITEESMIDKSILKCQINKLLSNGYKISLDDFGTGFSNFYSIKAFPFSNIKLDMTLVNDHFKNPDNLLPGVVSIFRERNLSITAEGIETKEIADEFERIGCNYLQGFYFSKPIEESQFLSLLENQKSKED